MKNVIIFLVITYALTIYCHNKYSKSSNIQPEETPVQIPSLKALDKPFRMAKLNKLWSKAQIRLSDTKLKSIFGELKLHDKEEITLKKMKSEGKDKDGMKEAEIRRKLIRIMDMYGLLQHFEDVDPIKPEQMKAFNEASEDHINKSLFKDKKLNRLWSQAENSGFSSQELQALKEEFIHHQQKIDEYYSILGEAKEKKDDTDVNSVDEKLERFNSLSDEEPNKDYLSKVNLLRERHIDLRDGYDRLHRLASNGPNSKEFVEPKVNGLWIMATNSNFTVEELESLHVELMHYENRLLKLRHLQAEAAINEEKYKQKEKLAGEKSHAENIMHDHIKKQSRKVEKMHLNLESKIMQKHTEL